MDERPRVTTFPSTDGAFRRAVERVALAARTKAKDELAKRLRPLFPRVAVFERELDGEPPQLYVFRDGRYELEPDDPWWNADDVARVCLSATTGRLTMVSPEYAAIIGTSPDDLVGRHYLDFVEPEAAEAGQAMFEALVSEREVTTEAVIRRVDGSAIRIQLHAAREDGEIDVRSRVLPGGPDTH
jgi:PAS domain S-box-containing protein